LPEEKHNANLPFDELTTNPAQNKATMQNIYLWFSPALFSMGNHTQNNFMSLLNVVVM
jgi:hypothetical protein